MILLVVLVALSFCLLNFLITVVLYDVKPRLNLA
jgi:hypothetical protein